MNELTTIVENSKHYNLQIEQALLSSLLSIESCFDTAEGLSVDTFYSNGHKKIYAAIERLANTGQKYDAVLVLNEIEGVVFGKYNAEQYLSKIIDSAPSSIYNFNAWIDQLNNMRQKREIEAITTQLFSEVRDNKGFDPLAVIDRFNSAANSLLESSTQGVLSSQQAVNQLIKQFQDDLKNGQMGRKTGFIEFDNKVKFKGGDLIIIGARPSMGKTTFALNVVESQVGSVGKPALVISLEMAASQIVAKVVSNRASVRLGSILNQTMNEQEHALFANALKEFQSSSLYIDDTFKSFPDMIATIKKLNREVGGLSCVCIDYLQIIPSTMDNKNTEIAGWTKTLKQLARQLDIPVFALSQLSRKCEDRPNKRPVNSDLRDSGGIESDADIILLLYRDEVYNKESEAKGLAEIIITKQRNGPIGTVVLSFNGEYSRFSNFLPAYIG